MSYMMNPYREPAKVPTLLERRASLIKQLEEVDKELCERNVERADLSKWMRWRLKRAWKLVREFPGMTWMAAVMDGDIRRQLTPNDKFDEVRIPSTDEVCALIDQYRRKERATTAEHSQRALDEMRRMAEHMRFFERKVWTK